MSLLSALKEALCNDQRLARQDSARPLELTIVESKARPSHTLFPWASDVHKNTITVQDSLVVLCERSDDGYTVPVVGLEAALYNVNGSSLLYISKVDTTGLLNGSSPARTLSAAFIAWNLSTHGPKTRVYVFAKSASQYLFPGSVENTGKRVLSDKQLSVWWKGTLDRVADYTKDAKLRGWFAFPGLEEIEARRLVNSRPSTSTIQWQHGHSFNELPPLCAVKEGESPKLGDLIPAFPDDPKSRFLTSLTSSPVNASGETGDYDDAVRQSDEKSGLDEQRGKERDRLTSQTADDFWERLAWRQECCSGVLVGFFVLAFSEDVLIASPTQGNSHNKFTHTQYTALWNQFHNVDYALKKDNSQTETESTTTNDLERLSKKRAQWLEDVLKVLPKSLSADQVNCKFELAQGASQKRKLEDAAPPSAPAVMVLKPRKKVKPTT